MGSIKNHDAIFEKLNVHIDDIDTLYSEDYEAVKILIKRRNEMLIEYIRVLDIIGSSSIDEIVELYLAKIERTVTSINNLVNKLNILNQIEN